MRRLLSFVVLLFFFFNGNALELPEPMTPKRIVNDFTGLFGKTELNALETKLRHFNDTSSTQIAVVTVRDLQGYDPNDYAQRLGEKWGIGQKGKDNGILILIKPKSNREKGQVAIAVGYGLEGVVPDITASRIIRKEIIPEFQEGKFYKGIDRATDILMELSAGEYTAEEYTKGRGFPGLWFLFVLVFFILPIFLRRRKGFTTDHHGSSGNPFIFLGGPGSGRNSGGFGGFSSGSGGFGGFGGGGFGGGGASGSW